jgi:hypothetical protein
MSIDGDERANAGAKPERDAMHEGPQPGGLQRSPVQAKSDEK